MWKWECGDYGGSILRAALPTFVQPMLNFVQANSVQNWRARERVAGKTTCAR
jgi:hypothetical protein